MTRALYSFFLLFLFVGCGGGTAGTSSTEGFGTKVIRGSLLDANNSAVEGARVSIEGSTVTSASDSDGRFSIVADGPNQSSNLSLKVEKVNQSKTFPISDLIEQTSGLNIQLKLDQNFEGSSVNGVEFTVTDIVGESCRGKFGKLRTFNFAGNPVPLLIVDQLLPINFGSECRILVELSFKGEVQPNTRLELFAESEVSSQSQSDLDARLDSQRLVSATDVNGSGVVEVRFNYERKDSFYLLEVSSGLARSERVGIVISLLNQE